MLIIIFEGREVKGLSKDRYDETFAGEDGIIPVKCQISGIKCPNTTIRIIRAKISRNTRQYHLSNNA